AGRCRRLRTLLWRENGGQGFPGQSSEELGTAAWSPIRILVRNSSRIKGNKMAAKKPTETRVTPPRKAWRIHFFQRDVGDDPARTVPGRAFLAGCPQKVREMMIAVVKA